jgi:phosphoribosyl 1,2-cyclic phosphodiesterase
MDTELAIAPAGQPETSVTFWGVRGSHPLTRPSVYGVSTTSLELLDGGRRVLVDAGTGIIALGRKLAQEMRGGGRIDILLSHLHHDHIQGLPFFAPAFIPGVEIHLHAGHLTSGTLRAALDTVFAPPFFPVTLDRYPARILCHDFVAGREIEVGGRTIATHLLNHPGGATAYRVPTARGDVAVVTDIEHQPTGPCSSLTRFCAGAELALYDTMFADADYPRFVGWGHSTPGAGLDLAAAAGIGRLIGMHFAPNLEDAALDTMCAELRAARPGSRLAREGLTVGVGADAGAV